MVVVLGEGAVEAEHLGIVRSMSVHTVAKMGTQKVGVMHFIVILLPTL